MTLPDYRVCPLCGQVYEHEPRTSAEDGTTPICRECRSRQAMRSLGMDDEAQRHVLGLMNRTVWAGGRDE